MQCREQWGTSGRGQMVGEAMEGQALGDTLGSQTVTGAGSRAGCERTSKLGGWWSGDRQW